VAANVDDVTLTFDTQALTAGVYDTTLTIQNDATPADRIDVPITLHVLPPPFRLGDRLTGAVTTAEDIDKASFEAFSRLTAKLTIDRGAGDSAVDVVVLDPTGSTVASWHVAAGKKVKKKVKLQSTGAHVIHIDGGGAAAGAFDVKTKFQLPGAAKPRVIKKLKPSQGDNFADLSIKALAGATLEVKVKPKTEIAGSLTLMLFDPDSASVDLAAHLAPNGLSFTGVALDSTGCYRLRISGFSSSSEKVKVVITPLQPKGTDTLVID
jgi:hypothetical protein